MPFVKSSENVVGSITGLQTKITLTDQRFYCDGLVKVKSSQGKVVSKHVHNIINLDAINAVTYSTSSKPALIVIALIVAVASVLLATLLKLNYLYGILVISVIFIAIYIATRCLELTIEYVGGNGLLIFNARRISAKKAHIFIADIFKSKESCQTQSPVALIAPKTK
ncbi:MAG: hypothetical protein RR248_00995 [Clostridia bacterium]